VKVLDFGLAKVLDDEQPAASAANSPTLTLGHTRAGVILGTAAYMSPEQAVGKTADRRSDIFSFGSVLFELLTGQRAFGGDTAGETLVAVAKDEPDWSKLPAGTPRAMQKLLRRCLVKDRKQRLQAIGEARILLESPEEPPQVEVPPVAGRPHRPVIWMASTAVMFLALAALTSIHFRETPPPEHTLRYTIAPPENTTFVHSFAVSPDGRLVVLAARVNGKLQLWLRPLDALQWQLMPTTDDARYPFWSPDSRNIGFFAEGKLRRIAAAGGPSQPVCDSGDTRGGTWSREDLILFSPGFSDNVIRRVPAAGGAPTDVTKAKMPSLFPVFLPDARHFLYLVTGASAEKNGVYVASLDGAENLRVLADNSGFSFAPPAPGSRIGQLLFLRENILMAQPLDAGTAQLAGEVFPVAENVSLAQNTSAPVTVSDNGVLLFWTGGNGGGGGTNQIVWYDRAGKATPVGMPGNVLAPAISPDEKMIAFTKAAAGGGNRDIMLRDLDRGNERRLTTDASNNFAPFWSPKTGDHIVFRSNRGGHPGDLYLRASNGSGQDEPLVATPIQKVADQWSRDGRFVVYSEQDPKTKWDLWYLPMSEDRKGSGKAVQFLHSEFNEVQGQLSPDSHWMAYTSDVLGNREVYVQPFPVPDNEIRISTAGGEQPRWSGDGKELFYLAADRKIISVKVTVSGGAQAVVEARHSRAAV